jgi:octaheme c-type cytochrome (tetrathionate reductase family)
MFTKDLLIAPVLGIAFALALAVSSQAGATATPAAGAAQGAVAEIEPAIEGAVNKATGEDEKVAAESAQSVPALTQVVVEEPEEEKSKSTADHSKFEELDIDFKSGPQVTKACLQCHTEAAKQIHKTKHWTWEYTNPDTGQKLGKKHVINNFCTSVKSNNTFCSACHIGYGWADDSFDFTAEANVDCLVCHDTTGTYKKLPGLSGHPNYETIEWPPHSGKFRPPTDLKQVAQEVGPTSRKTCGTCHFYGGGGDAVKHGDLDSSLTNPGRYLDVHMDSKGLNFTCSTCHVTDEHEVSGSRYGPTAADEKGVLVPGSRDPRNPTTCVACHGNTPHPDKAAKLNDHTRKLACQTCHIPAYARSTLQTKMSWDWSTAGKLDEQGHRIQLKNSAGKVVYDSKKGNFTYDRYVVPEYQWFNGKVDYTLFGDKVSEDSVVKINEFQGDADDPEARIWPVRVFRGKQMYDKGLQTLAVLHTAGKDDAAFWGNYDWDKAMEVGMRTAGSEYSGELGFVSTEMSWPITHMVSPKEDALACESCHTDGGRLAGIDGIYLPARDRMPLIDMIGFGVALLALIGVLIHGGIRVILAKREG